MASGGLYSLIYITIHSPINYLCALDTTLRVLELELESFIFHCKST